MTVLGGSGQQSARVLDAMGTHWRAPAAPTHLLDGPPGLYKTRLIWGNTITALTASQTSVRGAHPARLRLDEADEMRLPILEAAQGQTMDQGAVRAQTVIASTHQHPDGTMTAVLQRAAEQGWPVYQWCWQETQEPAGWLPAAQVTRKRAEITAQMWRTEFDLQEPSAEGRAIDPEAVEWAFDAALGEAGAAVLDHGWEATPTTAAAAAADWYAHGADWAQAVDFTVVVTLRCDVTPLQLVAATRTHRRPWPVMIGILNDIGTRYPGPVAHDATGGGTVVAEYVTLHDVIDFQMTGAASAGTCSSATSRPWSATNSSCRGSTPSIASTSTAGSMICSGTAIRPIRSSPWPWPITRFVPAANPATTASPSDGGRPGGRHRVAGPGSRPLARHAARAAHFFAWHHAHRSGAAVPTSTRRQGRPGR